MPRLLYLPMYNRSQALSTFGKIREPGVLAAHLLEAIARFREFGKSLAAATPWPEPQLLGCPFFDEIVPITWRSAQDAPAWLLPADHRPVLIEEEATVRDNLAAASSVSKLCWKFVATGPDEIVEGYVRIENLTANQWLTSSMLTLSLLRQLAAGTVDDQGEDEVAAITYPRRSSDAHRR